MVAYLGVGGSRLWAHTQGFLPRNEATGKVKAGSVRRFIKMLLDDDDPSFTSRWT